MGNGCWVGKNGPVAYVYSATGYVQFGFFRGSSLKDPRELAALLRQAARSH